MILGQNNWAKLAELIAVLLEIDTTEVTEEMSPETVAQWDSLNHVSICTAVSQEFSISMTTEEMVMIRNVGDLVTLLTSKKVPIK